MPIYTRIPCVYIHKDIENTGRNRNTGWEHCVLMGDFNINLLNIHSNGAIQSFFDIMSTESFLPLITKPTRIMIAEFGCGRTLVNVLSIKVAEVSLI